MKDSHAIMITGAILLIAATILFDLRQSIPAWTVTFFAIAGIAQGYLSIRTRP